MSQSAKSFIKFALLIAALAIAIWLGLRWFGGLAEDNAGDYDGGKSRAEEIVNDQLSD